HLFPSCVPPCFPSTKKRTRCESTSHIPETSRAVRRSSESFRRRKPTRAAEHAETEQHSSGGVHHSRVGVNSNRLSRPGAGFPTTCSEDREQEQPPRLLRPPTRATPESTGCLGGEITGCGAHNSWKANQATSCNSHIDGLRERGRR
ncbi:unnamed protein product, partial [Scytosiphon promiscuus]